MINFFIKNKKYFYYITIALVIFIGVLLRLNLFINNTIFEDDECRLAISLMFFENLGNVFQPLYAGQSAPPFFVLASKIIAMITNYNEQALKMIPMSASILSIFVFYKFAESYFRQKVSVILSLFILSLSYTVIYYADIFKQYSLDILIGILCLYYLPKVKIIDLSIKNLILLTLTLVLLPLISLPSLFFIAAFGLKELIENFKNKKFYQRVFAIFIPFVILMGLYYIFLLAPSQLNMAKYFPNYWDDGFLKFSFENIIHVFAYNFRFFFEPNNFILFHLILFVWGIGCCIVDKSETKEVSRFVLYTLGFILLASILHIYPFLSRVAIYSMSIIIVLIVKPLDFYNYKKALYWVALFFILLSSKDFHLGYVIEGLNVEKFIQNSPESLLLVLKEKYNPKTDVVVYNEASSSSFLFYSLKHEFNNAEAYQLEQLHGKNIFSDLDKNKKVWIYVVKDYRGESIASTISDYLATKDVLYKKQDRSSFLLYVKNL